MQLDHIDQWHSPMVDFMMLTGMIQSEIAGLLRTDIRSDHIMVQHSIVRDVLSDTLKTVYRVRKLPITDRMRNILQEVLARTDSNIGRYFFTGGIMPSDHLLFYFNDHLLVEDHWRVNGRHYQQTCEDWLLLQDARREQIMPILEEIYGEEAEIWFQRWRVFFMACAELFGYNNGNEWFVGHYLLRKVSC